MKEGVYGNLSCIEIPCESPESWTNIASGKGPSKHGIKNWEDMKTPPRTKRIWEILSDYGKFVGVIGWIHTAPCKQLNGIMITGPFEVDFCPKNLSKEMEENIDGYYLDTDISEISEEMIESSNKVADTQTKVASYYLKKYDFNFFCYSIFSTPDRIQHFFLAVFRA